MSISPEKEYLYNTMYMNIAFQVSKMSHAKRKQVGAILVKDDSIISHGWNGMPSGWDNDCEDEHGKTKPEVLHAESNLITKLARRNESGEDGVVYVTASSCLECAKLLAQLKICKVYYAEEYLSASHGCGLSFLERSGIETVFFNLK